MRLRWATALLLALVAPVAGQESPFAPVLPESVGDVTGWQEFHFADGTLAVLSGSLLFGLSVRLPTGTWITIRERAEAPRDFPL